MWHNGVVGMWVSLCYHNPSKVCHESLLYPEIDDTTTNDFMTRRHKHHRSQWIPYLARTSWSTCHDGWGCKLPTIMASIDHVNQPSQWNSQQLDPSAGLWHSEIHLDDSVSLRWFVQRMMHTPCVSWCEGRLKSWKIRRCVFISSRLMMSYGILLGHLETHHSCRPESL